MKKKTISKRSLNLLMKQLPKSILDHSFRCQTIASFILKQCSTENWYLELDVKEDYLVQAIYYHDIGKVGVKREDLYYRYDKTKAQKLAYLSHVDEGIKIVNQECGMKIEEAPRNSFEGVLYKVITEHHEQIDGKGYPIGLTKNQISFYGKFAAFIDAFDNYAFQSDGSYAFNKAVKEMMDGQDKLYDKYLVNVLISSSFVLNDFLQVKFGEKKDSEKILSKYGLGLEFECINDLLTKDVAYCISKDYIEDPFYGRVESKSYETFALKLGLLPRIDTFKIKKNIEIVARFEKLGLEIPPIILNFEAASLEGEEVYTTIDAYKNKYGVSYDKFIIGCYENNLLTNFETIKAIISNCHLHGYDFAIFNFGVSSLAFKLDELDINYVIFDESITNKVVSNPRSNSLINGLYNSLAPLSIKILFRNLDTEKEEYELRKIGATYAGGPRYENVLNESELKELLVKYSKRV